MTDYTDHADSLFDAGAPVLGPTHLEARDNLIATAEGSNTGDGAPRVQGKALGGMFPGLLSSAGTTSSTSLSDVGWICGPLNINWISGSENFQLRFSNDGGSSYGSWQTVISAIGADEGFWLRFSLQTGAYAVMSTSGTSSMGGTGTLTVPSDCDAFEARRSGTGSSAWAFDPMIMGGIE